SHHHLPFVSATTPTLSPLPLPDALPIWSTSLHKARPGPSRRRGSGSAGPLASPPGGRRPPGRFGGVSYHLDLGVERAGALHRLQDRKSTRLNSSHVKISYAVFCLKKKKL